MITREAIEARLADLRAQREQLVGNLNAFNGAIQDCEFWLAEVDKAEQDGDAITTNPGE
uniref:Uncharacterized protein n=1 Tax=viral metagenome TaxID=1070528 RepID=A0A6M3IEM1_9ZZZZ